MSDAADQQKESGREKCPECGGPVKYDEVDTTPFGEGRERQRGAARCWNKGCVVYGRPVRPV